MKKLISTFILITVLSGCTVEAYDTNNPETVVVQPAENRVISDSLIFSSVLSGEKETIVAAKTSGQVINIAVDIGDPIKANQNLVSLAGESELAQQGGAWSAYKNSLATLETIKSLYDEKIDAAKVSLLTYEETAKAAEKDLTNENSLIAERLKEAELALESAQISKQLLEETFDQQEIELYENMEAILTQITILSKNTASYLYEINGRPLSENKLEVSPYFTVSKQEKTVAQNSIREFKNAALELEYFYNNLQSGYEEQSLLEQGHALAKQTLEIGKTAVQNMYNVVVESGPSGFITNSMLTQYEQTLSSYGSQIEAALTTGSATFPLGLISLELSLSELAINKSNKLAAADKAVEQASQSIELLQASSNSVYDNKESTYFIQKSTLDQAAETIDMAEAEKQMQLQLAQAQVDQARSQLAVISSKVADTQLIAPYDGVVAERFLDEGSIVTMGTPILKVVDISSLKLIIYVPEEQVRYVEIGQQGVAVSSSFPDEEFVATVERIAPTTEENSKKVRVELSIPNQNEWLKIGMYMDLELKLSEDRDAIVIPEEAVQSVDGEEVVYVVKDGVVALQTVTRGEILDGWVEIKEGIISGEQIITRGWSLVSIGDSVQIYNQIQNEQDSTE